VILYSLSHSLLHLLLSISESLYSCMFSIYSISSNTIHHTFRPLNSLLTHYSVLHILFLSISNISYTLLLIKKLFKTLISALNQTLIYHLFAL